MTLPRLADATVPPDTPADAPPLTDDPPPVPPAAPPTALPLTLVLTLTRFLATDPPFTFPPTVPAAVAPPVTVPPILTPPAATAPPESPPCTVADDPEPVLRDPRELWKLFCEPMEAPEFEWWVLREPLEVSVWRVVESRLVCVLNEP